MSEIKVIKEEDLVKKNVAERRFNSLHEAPGSTIQRESVRDAMFSIYGVETIEELFNKEPQKDVETVKEEISAVLEREVDVLGYS